MEKGQERLGDSPTFSEKGITPEEAIKRLFGRQEPIEVRRDSISRGEFMVGLDYQIELNTRIAMEAQNQFNEARLRIFQAMAMKEKVASLETNEYRVGFYRDGAGNLSLEGKPKKRAGFER